MSVSTRTFSQALNDALANDEFIDDIAADLPSASRHDRCPSTNVCPRSLDLSPPR